MSLEKNIISKKEEIEEIGGRDAFLLRAKELNLNEAEKDVELIETSYIMIPHTKGPFPHYILKNENDKITAVIELENTKEKYEWRCKKNSK